MSAISSSDVGNKLGFAAFLWKRFKEARVFQAAGSLTFTTLLALVPLLTVMLVVITAFPVFGDVSSLFERWVNDLLVPSGASAVSDYLTQFKTQAGGLTAVGLAAMTLSALLLMQTIERAFDSIWRARSKRPWWVRFSLYWAILTLAPVVAGAGLSASTRMAQWFPSWSSGNIVWAGFVFDVVLLYVLYRLVPNRQVPNLHALAGAVLTALLLEAAKWGFGIYVRNFNSYHVVYGAFAAMPLFLVWMHVLWSMVLGGAVLTACLSDWNGSAAELSDNGRERFDTAVQVLLLLKTAQHEGKNMTLQDFGKRIRVSSERLEEVLGKLAEDDYIGMEAKGWLLKTAADQIQLKALFERLVYQPGLEGDSVPRALRALIAPNLERLDISLSDFEQSLVEVPVVSDTPEADELKLPD
ncbi:YihY family inner membrane protein [Conchiformibius steedae]|uniref:YihY family inner membrane protein n=1 Tax=Conchiformibius steedae TaxID=153493 RepID=UPI0026F31008|nr:YihY family inner membrane protein [Conchiformibius steedae]